LAFVSYFAVRNGEHRSRDKKFVLLYEVQSESSWTVIVVTASVKEDERGGQGHTSTSLLHQSAM
jgi:hypothetical protein